MRILNETIIAIASLGLFSAAVTTTANAATWHKGTPAKLRGNWKSGKNYIISISKNGVHLINNGYGDGGAKAAHYKRVGKYTYKIKQKFAMAGDRYNLTFKYYGGHIHMNKRSYHRIANY